VKVATAFTLAHSITLTLTALDLVRLPGWIVELAIAGSIVFEASQNLLWLESSYERSRLAAAFVLALFHGIGFAVACSTSSRGAHGCGRPRRSTASASRLDARSYCCRCSDS
jgi:hypothetical protein